MNSIRCELVSFVCPALRLKHKYNNAKIKYITYHCEWWSDWDDDFPASQYVYNEYRPSRCVGDPCLLVCLENKWKIILFFLVVFVSCAFQINNFRTQFDSNSSIARNHMIRLELEMSMFRSVFSWAIRSVNVCIVGVCLKLVFNSVIDIWSDKRTWNRWVRLQYLIICWMFLW